MRLSKMQNTIYKCYQIIINVYYDCRTNLEWTINLIRVQNQRLRCLIMSHLLALSAVAASLTTCCYDYMLLHN